MRPRTISVLPAVLIGVAVLGVVAPARAEIGWTEADYAKHFGPATRSPVTPDEAQFRLDCGRLLVRFHGTHSREELWLIDRSPDCVPAALRRRAAALVKGKPQRQIVFHAERAAPAQIFEARDTDRTVQVDYRNGRFLRIGACRGTCVLLDRLLATDRRMDDLISRTEAEMRKEAR